MKEQLAALAAMSNKYGADANFVLAGGGNTSYKSADRLWVKGSGTALATQLIRKRRLPGKQQFLRI